MQSKIISGTICVVRVRIEWSLSWCVGVTEEFSPVWLPGCLVKRNGKYSPSLWHGFCPVKRTGKYFAKKWSEQKVLGIEVAGLYSTYQKYKRIDGPSSYQFRENWTWVFFPKKLQKSKLFSPKIRGFLWGQTWTVRTSNHPSNHPWKKIGGLLPRILSS